MRLLISILLLSTPLAVLFWWLSGIIGGFRLNSKLSPKAKRLILRLGIISITLSGAGSGLAIMKGCVALEGLEASASKVIPQSPKLKYQPLHSLGNVTATLPRILTRLKEETAEKDREEKRKNDRAAAQAVIITPETIQLIGPPSSRIEPKSYRKGPFCRVTCAAHHGGEYDVETVPELCRANWIPPEAWYVPGWYSLDRDFEITNPWPGPAQEGFEKYNLYWSPLQSEAKIIHRSNSMAGPRS